ncbi:S-adenosyl-L-methionine-dependent methyltransferase [Lentinula edodes]|uniref:S-adenosyl-L-methionine-dependent methyltransferase n=1 Tax=Lentinula edodes TaxID=5353 RepID=UPI001E8CAED8|nr:S-adenosyl-L-methionine-dependent methyltransferase [Lentinula edodes]KAH7881463.1 S-adenosyl-L-methionine-dependent methyltransferase [Lentinula edodes]
MGFFSSKSSKSKSASTTTTATTTRVQVTRLVKRKSEPLPSSGPAPSRSVSLSTSPLSSPLSSPGTTPPPNLKNPRKKKKSPEAGPSTESSRSRVSKKMRVDKPPKRASNANSRASSRSTINLASSPLEPIFRSRSSRSRSTSTFPSLSSVSTRNLACEGDGEPGPSHVSSQSVVRNLHKSYKAYFSNPADPDDSSFEPESYPYVDLEYPNNAATERFLLLAPKDKDHYNPIMDLEQTLYTIVDYYLTPSQRALIGNVPSDLLTETVSPPLSPSPSPPNSTASHASSGSMSSLTSLESSSHNEFPQPRVNYCRAVQRAINTKDGPLFIKTIKKINSLLSSFKYPTPPSDPFEPVPKNSLKERVATWSNNGGLPSKVLMRIIDENYQRCVGPHINKLRKYEAFTSKVYGEILPSLVHEILSLTKLNQDSLFMDLGSGVGNVVIQSALQTGCKSYGIELVEGPAQVAKEMAEQFKARCRMWGVACGEIELEEGDMLESPRVAELLPKADVVLVDNKVFEEKLNEALRPKFLDLKEGAIVISLKPFVSSLNGLNARVTERNVDDISAIFDVTERPYYPGSVSWGNNGGSYYIHRVDRVGYAEIRQKFESTTRGRRSAATAKYTPSKNTDESDWFGQ